MTVSAGGGGGGGPRGGPGGGQEIPIVSFNNQNSGDGNYQFSYETGNGISAQETGQQQGEIRASLVSQQRHPVFLFFAVRSLPFLAVMSSYPSSRSA